MRFAIWNFWNLVFEAFQTWNFEGQKVSINPEFMSD